MLNKKTIRELCLENLEQTLEDISAKEPLNDPYGVEFSEVYREPPGALTGGKKAVAIILEQTETKTELSYPVTMCELMVNIEVNVLKVPNQSMSQTTNDVLGAVERAIRANRNLGGLAIDTTPLGNESTPQGVYQSYAAGVCRLKILYRHHTNDPRESIGG